MADSTKLLNVGRAQLPRNNCVADESNAGTLSSSSAVIEGRRQTHEVPYLTYAPRCIALALGLAGATDYSQAPQDAVKRAGQDVKQAGRSTKSVWGEHVLARDGAVWVVRVKISDQPRAASAPL